MSDDKDLTPADKQRVADDVRQMLRSLDPDERQAVVQQMIATGRVPETAPATSHVDYAYVQDEAEDGDEPSENEFE